MLRRASLCLLCLVLNSPFVMADEEAVETNAQGVNDYQYLKLEPDIITNYIKPGKRIGFVRITIDLMARSKADFALLTVHEPLIRDKIITIFGQQTESMVKASSERERIRLRCLEEVNDLLYAETGKKPIVDIFFTKYLYQ